MKNKNLFYGITFIVAILFYPHIYSFEYLAQKSTLLYHRLFNSAYRYWFSNLRIFRASDRYKSSSKSVELLKYPQLNRYLHFFDQSKTSSTLDVPHSLIIVSGKSRSGKTFLIDAFAQELVNNNNNIKVLMPEVTSAINTQTIGFVHPTAQAFAPCIFVLTSFNTQKLIQRNAPEQLENFMNTMCAPLHAHSSQRVLYIIETSDCHLEALKELLVGYQPMIIELQFPNYQERLEHVTKLLVSYNTPQDDLADFCAQLTDGLSFSHITYLLDKCRVNGQINGTHINKKLVQELYTKHIRPSLTE